MVNDAAQYFARYIHDSWSKMLSQEQKASDASTPSPTNIVLIFISTQDRICYISSGTRINAILPWWRLEHVVQDMKQDLRKNKTGDALAIAIDDLTDLLLEGPPSFSDRINDFFERFGIVILFTVFTFVFATWGECRDRHKRIFLAERKSRMTAKERERARALQRDFQTKSCPICLEPFDSTPDKDTDKETGALGEDEKSSQKQTLKRVDSYGIPLRGTDGQPLKLLRCGHIFDLTCWQIWVDSGQGNPLICPVCRQDVGRQRKTAQRNNIAESDGGNGGHERREVEERTNLEQSSLFARMMIANTSGPSMLLSPFNNATTSRTNYNSIGNTSFAPVSNPSLRRMHPLFGMSSVTPPMVAGMSEQTPLFAQASTSMDEDDDY